MYFDIDEQSEQVSYLRDSCVTSCFDPVQEMAISGTRDLILDLKEKVFYENCLSEQDNSEVLANSIDLEYDSSYELLSSRSNLNLSEMSRSHGPVGILL